MERSEEWPYSRDDHPGSPQNPNSMPTDPNTAPGAGIRVARNGTAAGITRVPWLSRWAATSLAGSAATGFRSNRLHRRFPLDHDRSRPHLRSGTSLPTRLRLAGQRGGLRSLICRSRT